MQVEFNHDLLSADIAAVRDFFARFVKSFGPSQKKVADKPIGFLSEQHIRFRLMLVEMGPVKIFKTIVAIIGALILYFVLFRHSDPLLAIATVIVFVFLYVWIWGGELEKEKKDGKQKLDRYFVMMQEGISGVFKRDEVTVSKKKSY